MNKLPKEISQHILTIGPDYRNHRGGIGAVIEIYSKYFEQFNFITSYIPGSKISIVINYIICLQKLFIKLLFNKYIKIIHIHGASNGSFYRKFVCFLICKYIFGKKIIYHVHGGGFELFYTKNKQVTKKLIRLFINNSNCVICLSNKWESFFKNNFKQRNIVIIPNIIDYPVKSNFKNTESDILTLLFLGLITNKKGIFDLLEVIKKNKDKYKAKIRLIIGGNGETESLIRIIKEEKLADIVEFVGWIANTEKTYWLQNADIYILPSYIEGLPISILEAMSYGKPIISTNVGGIPEVVFPGKNGILIEPGNLIEIESAIDYFIKHPEKIEDYGKESELIAKKHLPEQVMKELSVIYTSILK